MDSSHWFITPFGQCLSPPPYSIAEYYLLGDTVISSVSYKKVFYRSETQNSCSYTALSSSFSLYALLREDTLNRKVYSILFQNLSGSTCQLNQEILLYDFDIQVGDTLKPVSLCHLINEKRITNVIPGNPWMSGKTFRLHTTTEELYEGIGSIYGLFEVIELPGGNLYPSLEDYCRGSLANCNQITSVVRNSKLNKNIMIFPNPFFEHFMVSSPTNFEFEYQIASVNGIILEKGRNRANTKIFTSLKKGIYIVKIYGIDKDIYALKKLIKLQ